MLEAVSVVSRSNFLRTGSQHEPELDGLDLKHIPYL